MHDSLNRFPLPRVFVHHWLTKARTIFHLLIIYYTFLQWFPGVFQFSVKMQFLTSLKETWSSHFCTKTKRNLIMRAFWYDIITLEYLINVCSRLFFTLRQIKTIPNIPQKLDQKQSRINHWAQSRTTVDQKGPKGTKRDQIKQKYTKSTIFDQN